MKEEKKSHKAPAKKRGPRTKPPAPDLDSLRAAELVPVTYLPMIEPAFSPDSLRWHLFNREHNGLAASGAVVKLGRRILIVPKRFRAWVQSGGVTSMPKGK